MRKTEESVIFTSLEEATPDGHYVAGYGYNVWCIVPDGVEFTRCGEEVGYVYGGFLA